MSAKPLKGCEPLTLFLNGCMPCAYWSPTGCLNRLPGCTNDGPAVNVRVCLGFEREPGVDGLKPCCTARREPVAKGRPRMTRSGQRRV